MPPSQDLEDSADRQSPLQKTSLQPDWSQSGWEWELWLQAKYYPPGCCNHFGSSLESGSEWLWATKELCAVGARGLREDLAQSGRKKGPGPPHLGRLLDRGANDFHRDVEPAVE